MKRVILFAAIILSYSAFTQPIKRFTTVLNGRCSFLHDGDTVKLQVIKYGNFYAVGEFNESYISIIKNSKYSFTISHSIPIYFNLELSQRKRMMNLYSYLIVPGSSVSIDYLKTDSFEFSGKDAKKLAIQFEKRKIRMAGLRGVKDRSPRNILSAFATLDSFFIKELAYLRLNKDRLGDTLYTILYADVMGESGLKIDNFLPYKFPEVVEVWREALKLYKDPVWEGNDINKLKSNLLQYSYTIANALIARYKWDSCVLTDQSFNVINCYRYFVNILEGGLRERVITTLLYDNKKETASVSYCLQSTFDFILSNDFRNLLLSLKGHLTTGSNSFKFQLPDTSGVLFRYDDFKGKVVLLDFWFTGCMACIELHPKLDSIISMYTKDQLVLVTISIDKERKKWINSIGKKIYTSSNSINLFTDGMGDSHPIIAYYLIASYPTLILIDKEGKLCNIPKDPRLDKGADLVKLIDESLNY